MKKIARIALVLFSVLISAGISRAQTPAGWVRVASDNGEFSAEVPADYDFFYDAAGFQTSKDQSNYKVENVHLFSSFFDNTLISFECYEIKKDGFDGFIDTSSRPQRVVTGIPGGKQVVDRGENYYFVRRYYPSKKFNYIVTTASRTSETPAMKRFLDSIAFTSDLQNSPPTKKAKLNFSALKTSNIELDMKEDLKYKAALPNIPKPSDLSVKPIQILAKYRPTYVDVARMRQIQGTIALKATFNKNGFIPKYHVLKGLPEGLVRQALFAAIRMKFLPQERNGSPEETVRVIEYNFVLY